MLRPLVSPAFLALVLLAPAAARAESPRVSARLSYTRSAGAEACPVEPSALRAQLAARMGYDPFDQPDAAARVSVVLGKTSRGFAARIERWNAAGVRTLDDTFPTRPMRSCEALTSPLASYLRAALLSGVPEPAAPSREPPQREPEPPPREPESPPAPAAPAPSPPPFVAPPPPPEPPEVPNPSRNIAKYVAIASSGAAGVFLALGLVWNGVAQHERNTVQALSAQLSRSGAEFPCSGAGGGDVTKCGQLLSAADSADTAEKYRNTWFAAAGISVAIGITSTVVMFALPATIKGQPVPRVSLTPTSLVISGTF